jgi:hypothetical protein
VFDSHPDLQRWEYSSNGLEWWSPKPQVIGSSPIAPANYLIIKLSLNEIIFNTLFYLFDILFDYDSSDID